MGPYDNELGKHLFIQEVFDAHWLKSNDTGALIIIAKEDGGFDSHGEIEGVDDEVLFAMSDSDLADESMLEDMGLSIVQPSLRRFNEEEGYYHA
jgi:hypothetical protein